jgi:hypothetical protein
MPVRALAITSGEDLRWLMMASHSLILYLLLNVFAIADPHALNNGQDELEVQP